MKNLMTLFFLSFVFTTVFAQNDKKLKSETPAVLSYCEQMPYPGYDLAKYLSDSLRYPESAIQQNTEGRVVVKFIVKEDGSIGNCTAVKGIGSGCDEEAKRVINAMPPWSPGKQNGIPVKVWFTLPVSFKLEEHGEILDSADVMPEPEYNFNEYLAKTLKMPTEAIEHKLAGKVVIGFVVNEDGSIDECHIKRGVCGALNAEAMRHIKNMPSWKPGKVNDKPVRTRFVVAINFAVDGWGIADDMINRFQTGGPNFSLSKSESGQLMFHNFNNKNKKYTKPDYYIFSSNFDPPDSMPYAGYDYLSFLQDHIQFPQKAKEKNIQGDVIVEATVNKDGSIQDCMVIKSLGYGCNEEALRAVKMLPKWNPGKYTGDTIATAVQIVVPFYFEYSTKAEAESKRVFSTPDQLPKCGYDIEKYLVKHLKYPETAKNKGVQGVVGVDFVVNETGEADRVVVTRSVGSGCDEESIKVVKNMPKWIPAKLNGKPVKSSFHLDVYCYRL